MLAPLLLALAGAASAACGAGEPKTDAERLARGREIITRMSDKLAAAKSFSVTTREAREQIRPSGKVQPVTLTRNLVVQRPNRLYVESAGDMRNQVWYDGVGVTLVMHKEKVFAQAKMPETLDKTLDAMHERYGIATPLGDFAYSSPAKALLSDTTTGGWAGRETIDGKEVDHLAFKDTGVEWQVWIPTSGDPLPVKAAAVFTEDKRLRKVEETFSDWNLAPQVAADRFTPTVPPDYEGIAMVQRARMLRNLPTGDEVAPPPGTPKK
jgi:hypothetical protein